MTDIASSAVEGGIGILTIDSPPVNALGIAVRRGIASELARLLANPDVSAIVVICAGRTFFAGADITEIGQAEELPSLAETFKTLENAAKPIVAAIHGTALGGGLELALVCHYRVAVPSAKVGLPEVHLGLLPGAGGTQRLPRLTGVEAALEIITSGRQVNAGEALSLGILDALADEGALREGAVAFARSIAELRPLVRVRDRNEKLKAEPQVFDSFRASLARSARGFNAPPAIVDAVQAAVTLPFEQGIAREWALLEALAEGRQSAAQRHYFFAERTAAKVPGIAADAGTLPIEHVGVIGAGTMGGGIAMNFLNIGVPVTLIDMGQESLDRGLGVIRRNYEASAKRGRMRAEQVEQRMALLTPSLDMAALAGADLVIEAVYESMQVKKQVFEKLDAVMRDGAILASNTSFLDLDEIALATGRPEAVVGLHFFSPANVMRLLEVVRGARTSPEVVATAMRLGKRIAKVPVLSGVCDGFIANRAMKARAEQADALILEGTPISEVDAALYDFGFAMGHFQVMDLVGLDVIGRDSDALTVMGEMVAKGRLGQKSGGGYYDYDEKRKATPAPLAIEIVADVAMRRQIVSRPTIGADAIIQRLLYPVVNESAKILEEGISLRPSDIDVALITGYGWPVQTGGPMFWADGVGLPVIVAALHAMADAQGDEAFRPAALLEKLAVEGKGFGDL
ncbi:MAG: 3-hydroxyacyl-CoA dehydrogenase NAD-binding domain-containing protein [Pseudomonadota bacterium]